ncbi:hypothetical protein WMY93_032851 [Mugilogobius chulae]|uniref:Rapunzel 4 n=1 Tax=Mugilogobius chulae TaxID=88201 RepID=A0AAW0MQN9_9GOBI
MRAREMADQVEKMLADNKVVIHNLMDVLQSGAEVVASFAGDIFPVFAIAAPIVKLALDNVESEEAAYMKEQFQKVRDRLDEVSEQIQRINDEIKKSCMDSKYFTGGNKEMFLEHFDVSEGDKNLHTLYNAVTGENFSGESVLEIIMNYEEKSRRAIEDFCARLKHLFCVGLIALLGHAALDGYGEEELLKEWREKMQTDCIVNFPKLAEEDCRRIVRDKSDLSCQELAQAILNKLKQKYDWVSWFIGQKEDFHYLKGKSCFQVVLENRPNVVVSYSSSPEPVDRERVSQIVLGPRNVSVVPTAELLFRELPGPCVVHTIKTKAPACCSSFSPEEHYWEAQEEQVMCASTLAPKHEMFVCVHSA